MGFDLLRTIDDVIKITALDRSAIAHYYHIKQFSLIYTLKWIENGFTCWMLRGSSITRALLLLLQCFGTNLDQDLSADVVFGSLFSSSCQQCKIKLLVRSIEMQLYWNYQPIHRTRTVSSIAQTIFLTCQPMGISPRLNYFPGNHGYWDFRTIF